MAENPRTVDVSKGSGADFLSSMNGDFIFLGYILEIRFYEYERNSNTIQLQLLVPS